MPTILPVIFPFEVWIALIVIAFILAIVGTLTDRGLIALLIDIPLTLVTALTSSIVGTVTESGVTVMYPLVGAISYIPIVLLVYCSMMFIIKLLTLEYEV